MYGKQLSDKSCEVQNRWKENNRKVKRHTEDLIEEMERKKL
jgi:Txe/YoeB family toxin of Txe-Axe toxin-antitoxin module